MGYEEIDIRVTKGGQIYVRIEGATEERLRDYQAFLEESIGPISSIASVPRPDWEKPAHLLESEEEQRGREQQIER